jgi:hypothetical protein
MCVQRNSVTHMHNCSYVQNITVHVMCIGELHLIVDIIKILIFAQN